ncbi:sulfite exporter TauE/SafE family protein [Aquincola sp. S2]|uniref:Probable membrane transporter protein n=1 Tax=Pseudaquabacterium terrae TaxID=2732868 RepID=A0ABX2E9C4_9BURK|nr:sulfite exporter TauE/SafE family protein [Aquabacterium terrae]NRF65585.1 sulfite exporter TauE/SafE family protein [Aquabacterium terrae]
MPIPLDLTQLLWLAAALAAAGCITGVLAGLFGVGGGAVLVPVLYEVFGALQVPEGVRMPLCVGTSLAVIVPTSLRSFRAHRAHGAADMEIVQVWAAPVVLGVLAGSAVARFAPAALFKGVFVVVATASALRLLFFRNAGSVFGEMPGKLGMRLYGAVIGVLSSLMGIGGGQLSNLFMTLYGRPIHQAIATSAGLGSLIAIPGAIGYMIAGWPKAADFPGVAALQFPAAIGYVSLIGFGLLMPTSAWAAPYGARLAHRWPKRRLELAFGIFLLLVSARFLVGLLGG